MTILALETTQLAMQRAGKTGMEWSFSDKQVFVDKQLGSICSLIMANESIDFATYYFAVS
jgi:hypothetical protein